MLVFYLRNRGYTEIFKKFQRLYGIYFHIPSTTPLLIVSMEVQKLLLVIKTQTQYLINENKDKIQNIDNKSIKIELYIYIYI